ncbi:hypothetical protein [Gardnerella vaginalis]|uniref:hypothetical protein n=1 Tax=Gardnerella vaginalis TaxID=2702 RepID=UPI0003547B7C|nr:hypothetical protein [Gardnerella vaginalis]EPI41191.1 hypothetical protein HMPREF1585_01308 [Gardnerella vaginalis JCP8481B]EPI41723.1 hypothetical protein HMPREF1584_01305 [Gardnerella vaginalis JCP8481A]
MNLNPDYSWVPSELGPFIGGIQAICIIALVLALMLGILRFVLAKATTTRIDDAIGDRVIISVIIACFFIGGLGQLVGHEIGAWNNETVTVTAQENASITASVHEQVDQANNQTRQNNKDAAQSFKKAGEKLKKEI